MAWKKEITTNFGSNFPEAYYRLAEINIVAHEFRGYLVFHCFANEEISNNNKYAVMNGEDISLLQPLCKVTINIDKPSFLAMMAGESGQGIKALAYGFSASCSEFSDAEAVL